MTELKHATCKPKSTPDLANALEHSALDLLPLPGVNAAPHYDCWETKSGDAGSGDQHQSLRVTVRVLDADSGWVTQWVAELRRDVGCDDCRIDTRLLGQPA